MREVRTGVIGCGNMGSSHARCIAQGQVPGLVLAAVADVREERRKWAAKNLPENVAVFSEGTELIDSGTCEAVLIVTPHYQHPALAVYGLEHGLHVLCEKPAGVYTRQVREMNLAAEKSDRVFAIMFNQRTNCIYRKMYELLHSGELGEIKRVNWIITDWYRTQAYYDSGNWRATWDGEGGGVLLNQCPHNLDLLQWLCGMPRMVQAFTHNGKWHDIEVEDDVTAYMEFLNGATGVFVTSTADAPGTNRLEITTEMGKLVSENGKLLLYRLDRNERLFCREAKTGFGQPECQIEEVETDGLNEQHAGVMKAFASAILNGTKPVAEGTEGIRGLMLSNAMHLSGWLGRPVSLPIDEELFLRELNKRRAASGKKSGSEQVLDVSGTYGS